MKPITLNSLIFSDMKGKMIVREDYYSMIFSNADHANLFMDNRKSYWEGILIMKLTISPDMNETIKIVEIKKVFRYTARFLQIPIEDVLSRSRRRPLVDARRYAIMICCQSGMPHSLIGEQIGLDRTTIIHHDNAMRDLMEVDKEMRDKYYEIEDFVLTQIGGLHKQDGSGQKIA